MQNCTGTDVTFACCLLVRPIKSRPSLLHRTASRLYVQLPAAEDQPLLLWRHTRLLLNLLLDPSDLDAGGGSENVPRYASDIRLTCNATYLVIYIDIQLDL
jgi:hypothetical protein